MYQRFCFVLFCFFDQKQKESKNKNGKDLGLFKVINVASFFLTRVRVLVEIVGSGMKDKSEIN